MRSRQPVRRLCGGSEEKQSRFSTQVTLGEDMKNLVLLMFVAPLLFAQEAKLTDAGTTWWSRNRFNFPQEGIT